MRQDRPDIAGRALKVRFGRVLVEKNISFHAIVGLQTRFRLISFFAFDL